MTWEEAIKYCKEASDCENCPPDPKTDYEKTKKEEGKHFGLIYDKCLTKLKPEEENGTTLTGVWFAPLDDEIAHKISKKFQLYK